jgi:large subunit ribosomal protein L9
MDVILLKDVDKVGLRGEVVSVSRGYMRNYLQPRRLAEVATEARVAELERREAQRALHEARSAEDAEKIAETLRKTVLTFEVNAGPQGTLFGSVTSTDVADEIWRARKIRVDRRKIDLKDPIKRIGRYEVPITVFEDVAVEVKTLVKPIGGELPPEEELEAMVAAEEAAEVEAEAEAAEAHAEAEAAIAEVEAELDAEAEREAAELDLAAEPDPLGAPENEAPAAGEAAVPTEAEPGATSEPDSEPEDR